MLVASRGPTGIIFVALKDNIEAENGTFGAGDDFATRRPTLPETRYLIPAGADWAVWDDANAVLSFMTDAEVIANARENEKELGDEFAKSPLPSDPTPEQAWAYVNALWEGDPGGRGWQVPVPAGASWLLLRDDEAEPAPDGPEPTFGFGEPPVGEGAWEAPGY